MTTPIDLQYPDYQTGETNIARILNHDIVDWLHRMYDDYKPVSEMPYLWDNVCYSFFDLLMTDLGVFLASTSDFYPENQRQELWEKVREDANDSSGEFFKVQILRYIHLDDEY